MMGLPFTIAVLSEKGGVGKTTLALHLAWMFAEMKKRSPFKKWDVLLIDADPQASILAWQEERKGDTPFKVKEYARATIHNDEEALYEELGWWDFCIIDCPPRVTDIARSAILASRLVVIPVTPSSLDVWAGQETIALIEESKKYRQIGYTLPSGEFAPYDRDYCIVLNRVIVNTEISRKVDAALRNAGFPVMDTWIKQRVAYAECVSMGKTIFETDPRGKAAIEMKQLFKDIFLFADQGIGNERP